MSKRKTFIRKTLEARIELLIFLAVSAIGSVFAWYVYNLGLVKTLVDQNSHLNISRQITDSLTPGMSQIGLWPPLLHVLMSPASAVNSLFQSGLAGAVLLVPLLGIASVMLYRLIRLMTPHVILAISGVVLFISNPYILYYAVTPMTELLFITTIIGTAYFTALWIKSGRITHLIYASFFVVGASLARFEGFILIPIVALVALFHLRGAGKRREEIEAILILFGTVAMVGVFYTLAYGWTFAGDPLAFMNSTWSAGAQQQDYVLPTASNVFTSFQYLFFASIYMIGLYQILFAIAGFAIAIFVTRKIKEKRRILLATGTILASPFIFDILALIQGSAVLYVPDLFPYGSFFNERYGLYWIGFVVFGPLAMVAALTGIDAKNRFQEDFRSIGRFIGSTALVIVMISNLAFLYRVAFVNEFSIVRESAQGFLADDQRGLASALSNEYDDGNIFITRALQNFVTVDAGIELKNYIHESNYPYYDQTLERPWLFAKWVVMYNPGIQVASWRKSNELISTKWGDSHEFAQAYELIYENDSERLYRLRSDVIYVAAREQGIDTRTIPSLNPDIAKWDPDTVYDQMQVSSDDGVLAGSPGEDTGGISKAHAEELNATKSIFFK